MMEPYNLSVLAPETGSHSALLNDQDDQPFRTQIPSKKTLKSILRSQPRSSSKKQLNTESVSESKLTPIQTTQLSHLEQLPSDILLLIASILPIEAIYSLSLTSRTMSQWFPRDELLSKYPLAKKHFLLLLENDHPDYLVCYTCDRLYRWRVPGSSKVQLCPGRKDIPHHDYGRLDITSHSKRIPREMIDLALRNTSNHSKRGTTLKGLTKQLQEHESIDCHLRMRAQSYVLTSVVNNSLIVTTVFGVRISTAETSHPLYWLARHNLPNEHVLRPPAREFRHHRFSSLTRLIGCNYHEFLMFDGVDHSEDYVFIACSNCKTSVRIARDYYFDKWINVNIEIAQAFGTRDDLAGDAWCYAGLTRAHRTRHPDETIHFMRCFASPDDQPAFTSQESSGDETHNMDLSLNAWFNRHIYARSQRVWPRAEQPEDENVTAADDSSDSDSEVEENPAEIPIYTDEVWNGPRPDRVTSKSLSVRKRWFDWSVVGTAVVLMSPWLMYDGVKKAIVSARQKRREATAPPTPDNASEGWPNSGTSSGIVVSAITAAGTSPQ